MILIKAEFSGRYNNRILKTKIDMRKKTKLRSLLLCFLTAYFIMPAPSARAQEFSVKSYTVMDGLPSSTVHSIAQDGEGKLWFASRNGIAVYDGVSWKNYSKKDGLGSTEFIAVSSDNSGKLWGIAKSTSIQLVHFTDGSFKLVQSGFFPELSSDFTSNKCFAVYTDSKDTIAVVATGLSGIYVFKNGNWKRLSSKDGLASNEVRDVKEKDGLFYIVTSKGISLMDRNLSLSSYKARIPQQDVSKLWSIYFENDNNKASDKIWMLGETFVSFVQNGVYTKKIKGISLGEITRIDYPRFFPAYYNFYFFGTQRNIFVYNDETGKTTHLTDQKNSVFTGLNSILKDRENNLWIISNRGVHKIRIPKFNNFNSANGLLKDEVSAITQLENSMVFGHEEGISIYSNGKVEVRKINNKRHLPADYRVMQLDKDREGNVWIAAAKRGLGKLSADRNIHWISMPKEESLCVVSVAADKTGKIFVATNNNVYSYSGGKFSRVDIGALQGEKNIRRIDINDKNEIVICTIGLGLFVGTEKGNFKNYQSKSNYTINSIYSSCTHKDTILAGTLNGLYFVSGDSLAKYKPIEVDRPIYFIGKDGKDFWIGTDYGVIKWHDGVQVTYTPHENLSGLETNRSGFYVDSKGDIWIGTDKGVSQYRKPKTVEAIATPGMTISFVDNDENLTVPKENIEQEYSNNSLTVNVNVLSFINENQNSYTAMLENFDDEWLPEIKSSEKLRYTNLPPGAYRLHIKGKNAIGVWSREYISPEILILSPFYLRWWFLLFIGITLVGVFYLVMGFIGRKKYAAHLEEEVSVRTSDLRDSEIKYRNLVNNIFEGVAVVQNNKVRFMNPAMASMIGSTIDDVLGKEWTDYAYAEDLAMLAEKHRLRLSGVNVEPQVELRLKHLSGRILTVIANTILINYEGAPAVFTTIRDVTEEKAREAQLVNLFTAVQHSPSSVIVTGADGKIEYVNPVFEKITGYSKDEVIGIKTNLIKSGMMPENIYRDLWDTISSGNIWRGEMLNQRKNKEFFWVSASIAPIKNPEGVITNYIAVEDDITFEKFARQEIEKKERLLNATLDKAPVIIFTLDKLMNFSFIKGKGLDLLGYSKPDELLGMPLEKVFGQNETNADDLKKIALNEPFTSLRFAKEFVFEVHYTPVSGSLDNNASIIGLAINITAYYNAEKTIKESEAKIKALVNAIPDYIFEVGRDKRILTYHEPLDAKTRYPYGELKGRTIKNTFPTIWKEIEDAIDNILSVREDQINVFSFVINEERKYMEARFVLKNDETILAIVRDVTEKVISERELISAKEEAEKSDRLKSEFLAHMSHEIRTPVNTIMNFTSLMEEELQERLSEDLKDGFRIIRDGGFRLIRTIDLILNMSQMQTGTYHPVYKKINIDEDILYSIVQEFLYRAKRKNIDLIYTVENPTVTVYGDDYTIGQIFANLIDNALKYTNKGKIEIVVKNAGNSVVVEVADTGIGISSEYLPKLFSPFTQEEMGYTRRFDGTGLGLALVKNYIDINKAQILVESEKDKGTKFIVKFPIPV